MNNFKNSLLWYTIKRLLQGIPMILVVVLFCTLRRGWGWDNFIKEANTGEGRDFPQWLRPYLKYVLPALILIVFAMGYVPKFQIWLGLA